MIRGTTAQFKFKLPYSRDGLKWVTIKFWQPGNDGSQGAPLPITRRLADCGVSENPMELCVSLHPHETERFVEKYKAKVQLRAQYEDGTVFGSRPTSFTVYPMSDEILDANPSAPFPDASEEDWYVFDGQTISN